MKLLDTLRSLFGASHDTDKTWEPVFSISPDSDGLNFHLPIHQYQQVRQGGGSIQQKAQLTLLNMLHEQKRAKPIANGFWISASDAAGLDDDEAEVLGLPPRLDGRFITRVKGHTGQSAFQVDMTLRIHDGECAFQRRGPYLLLGSLQKYRLTPAELLGLEAWHQHQNLKPEERGEAQNLRLMAMLQTASRSGMNIDLSHFSKFQVLIPKDIGVVATRMPDGSLELCPTLGDGSTPEQLRKRWHQLEVDANGGVLRVDNRIVLIDQERMAGIRNVFANRRIPSNKAADFIASPTAFLDAALVNLEMGFSVRVAGIGRIEHLDTSGLGSGKIDWFSLQERPVSPEKLSELIQSVEDLDRFTEILEAARLEGADTLEFDNHRIDISDQKRIEQLVEQRRTALQNPNPDETPAETTTAKTSKSNAQTEQVTVLLKEASEIHSALLGRSEHAPLAVNINWKSLHRQPYPHQQEGVEWMVRLIGAAQSDSHDNLYRLQGALLADDMGLGKTYMSLVAANHYLKTCRHEGLPEKPILVIAPLSLLENWEDEVQKTFSSSPFRDICVLQGGRDLNRFKVKGVEHESRQLSSLLDVDDIEQQQHGIRYALHIGPEAGTSRLDMDRRLVLATYQTLRDYQFSLCKIDWGIVIFDEAQNIKNPNTLQTRAAKGLKADFKLLATGTPVENSLGDFWCLMDTAQPGLLGDWKYFRDTWVSPIKQASDHERDAVRTRLGRQLRENVGQFMLRRLKEEQLKGLPSKITHTGIEDPAGLMVFAPELGAVMSGSQLEAYDQALAEHRQRCSSSDDNRGTALKTLSRLRAISLHPRLGQPDTELLPRDAQHARQLMSESGKLSAIVRQLERIRASGEKVILFMMTKQLQRLMKQWLDLIHDLDISIINGDTKAVSTKTEDLTRKNLITQFENRPGFNILIMSPIAAGVGLTVVGANHVIHVERHWNPAKEAQATDRVYRIGQKKDVHVHLPILEHPALASFDVHLDRLLRNKLILKDAVVSADAVSEQEMIQSLGLIKTTSDR